MVTTSPLVLVLPCMRFVRARLCLLFLFDKSRFLSKHVNPVPRNSANRRVQLARSTDARVHEPTLKIFPWLFYACNNGPSAGIQQVFIDNRSPVVSFSSGSSRSWYICLLSLSYAFYANSPSLSMSPGRSASLAPLLKAKGPLASVANHFKENTKDPVSRFA